MADHAALLRKIDAAGIGELQVEAHRRPARRARLGGRRIERAIVPIGESSVMPQLVCTWAPRRFSIRRISASGQFAPPMNIALQLRQLAAHGIEVIEHAQPQGLDAGGDVTASSRIIAARLAPSVWRPGRTILAPTAGAANGSPQALAWNIGTATSNTSLPVSAMASACSARSVCR